MPIDNNDVMYWCYNCFIMIIRMELNLCNIISIIHYDVCINININFCILENP